MNNQVLQVAGIDKFFSTGLIRKIRTQALKGISFSLNKGKCLAVVGESGSGKSTLGRIILGMEKPSAGNIFFKGKNIFNSRNSKSCRKAIQMIPQDATASLNPTMKVRELLLEPFMITKQLNGNSNKLLEESLEIGKLTSDLLSRFPHELSGGQRQRIAIARTLCLKPSLIIADEPAASLDRSIQAHVLTILKDKVEKESKLLILITHDLRSVRLMAHQIAVMYYGCIVEYGSAEKILNHPCHPYTIALISSVPGLRPRSERIRLKGEPPSPINPPTGCTLHPRCPVAVKSCEKNTQTLQKIENDHWVRCSLSN